MSAAPQGLLAEGALTPDPAAPERAALDAALLTAHAMGDRDALIRLYAQAAELSHDTAAAFYLTHAYVFALEAGDPRAVTLRARLVAIGADLP